MTTQTKREELLALADRCEREEASRDLDGEIAIAAGWLRRSRDTYGAYWVRPGAPADSPFMGDNVCLTPPPYTTSLDAAVSLVPEEYRLSWSVGDHSGEAQIFGRLGYEHEATGLTPALALCSAALRARASLTDGEV